MASRVNTDAKQVSQLPLIIHLIWHPGSGPS